MALGVEADAVTWVAYERRSGTSYRRNRASGLAY